MKTLAQGVYRYWRDGLPQGVTEPWQLDQMARGWTLRGQRVLDGRPALAVEADYQGSRCTQMRVTWHRAEKPLTAHYRLRDSRLEWRTQEPQTLALPPQHHLFPLLRAASGPLLQTLTGGPQCVVVPNIRDTKQQEFLHPLLSERHAECLGKDKEWGKFYRYYGGEYGATGADYWLDESGLVTRYCWESSQGLWEVRLEERRVAADFSWNPSSKAKPRANR